MSHPSPAEQRINQACRQAVAGKLAMRELAVWVRPVGLSEAEFRLLWSLVKLGDSGAGAPAEQSALAVQLAASPAQVSMLVERLRLKGLIECSRASDRRRQAWRLTKAGGETIARVVGVVAAAALPQEEAA
ncbi:MAG: hypothetical protein DCC67_05560 [Planctomycetota bacterium]|nr:MAG: hypothetical protein DCC67_05560 [Planctomycetota bacterium]